jgi:hypothetical protein
MPSDPASKRPTLAVVIPAWNDAAELPGTLAALARSVEGFVRTRVVVVAGGSDGSFDVAERALSQHEGVDGTVLPQRPHGKMAAIEDAMSMLDGEGPPDWLLILDADTHVLPGALEAGVAMLSPRADLIGIGPRLRLGPRGLGAAHDLVSRAMAASRSPTTAVSGGALLMKAPVLWEHLRAVFMPPDYPLHIDYQICERASRASGLRWGYAPGFVVETPRARGMAFLRAERRHHRAMVARGGWRSARYLTGASLNCALPLMPGIAMGTAPFLPLWPVGGALVYWTLRRLARWKREHAAAGRIDPQAKDVSLWAYGRDEWVFSISALLGAFDHVRQRLPEPTFRGARR